MVKKIFIVTAIIGALCIPISMGSAKTLSRTDLKDYSLAAPCDECCNPTGGANCSGTGSSVCESVPYSGPLNPHHPYWVNIGESCKAATNSWAEDGADDADCDNATLHLGTQTCAMTSITVFCSNFQQCTCTTEFSYSEFDSTAGCWWEVYYCESGSATVTTTPNDSRKTCTGDPCWW